MTTIELKGSASESIWGHSFKLPFDLHETLADAVHVIVLPGGFSIEFDIKNGIVSLAFNAPIVGKVFSRDFNEKGTHSIDEKIGTGELAMDLIIS